VLREITQLAATVSLLLLPAALADWPRWRGPKGDGISPQRGTLAAWAANEGPQVLWRAEVHTGFSGLAVGGGRVFTLGNSNDWDVVTALDAATGKALWKFRYPARLDPNLYEGGPGAMPTLEGERLYTLSKWGDLFCLEAATGDVIWSRRLTNDAGIALPNWGLASGPLILGDRVYLNAGGRGLALHKQDGRVVWANTLGLNGYSACVPYDHQGTPALALLAHREAVGVAQADGRLLWSKRWFTQYDMNCPDPLPVAGGGLLLTGYKRTAELLDFAGGAPAVRWQSPGLSTHLSPGVTWEGHLYTYVGDAERTGAFVCADLATGEIRWRVENVPPGSVIAAGGCLLLIEGKGRLILARPDPAGYHELARAQILPEGRAWTPPSFSNGVLYARNARGHVVAVALPWTPAAEVRPALDARKVDREVEVTWPGEAADWILERYLPATPELGWRVLAPGEGTLSPGLYRCVPAEAAAWFRLRRP
jgi:outer membrane protein assembly factor BamB